MKIHISDEQSIMEVKQAFYQAFPMLKIEFFTKPHAKREPSDYTHRIDVNTRLKDIRKKHNEGDIHIAANMKVATVEENFLENFGLYVQVFRKHNDIWLETTVTDDWTIAHQEQLAHEIAAPLAGEKPADFDLSDVD